MSLAVPGLGGGGILNILTLSERANFNSGYTIDSAGGYADFGYSTITDASSNIYFTTRMFHLYIYNASGDEISSAQGGSGLSGNSRGFIVKYDNNLDIVFSGVIRSKNSSTAEEIFDIVADASQNVYTTGYIGISGDTILNYQKSGESNTINIASRRSGLGQGCIIVKIKNDGFGDWGCIIDTSGNSGPGDIGRGITCDLSNNITIVGEVLGGNIIIDNINNVIATRQYGLNRGLLIAKYDTSSTACIWSRIIESSGGAITGNSIISDKNNNIYVIGNVNSGIQSIIDSSNNFIATRQNGLSQGMIIAKYALDGSFCWGFTLDTSGSDTGNGINVDNNDNIYITGTIAANNTIIRNNNNQIVATRNTTDTGQGILLAKYSTDGLLLWSRIIDSSGNDNNTAGNKIGIDSKNNVYITGTVGSNGSKIIKDNCGNIIATRGFLDLSSGIILAKYNTYGAFVCGYLIDSISGSTNRYNDTGYAIAIDKTDNVIISGSINGATIKDNLNNTLMNRSLLVSGTTQPKGGQGAFICKLSLTDISNIFSGTYNISNGYIEFNWNIPYIYTSSIKPVQYRISNISSQQQIISKYTNISYNHITELSNSDISYNYQIRVANGRGRTGPITANTHVFIPGYSPIINTFVLISPIEISFNFYLHPSMNQYVNGITITYKPTLATINDTIIRQLSLSAGTALGNNSIYTDKLVPDTLYFKIIYTFTYNIRSLTTGNAEYVQSFKTPAFASPSITTPLTTTSNSLTVFFNKITSFSGLLISGDHQSSYIVNQSGGEISYSIGNVAFNGSKYVCTISGLESNTTYSNIVNVRALYKYGYFKDTIVPEFTTAASPIIITLIEPSSTSVTISWTLSGATLGIFQSQAIIGTDALPAVSSTSNSITISGLFPAKIYNDWKLSTTFASSNGPIITPVKQFATLVDFASTGTITPKIYVDAQYFSNTISGLATTASTQYELSDTTQWISQYNSSTISGAFYKEGYSQNDTYPTYNNDGSYSYIQFNSYNDGINGNYLEFGPQQFDMSTNNGITIIGAINMNGMTNGSIFNFGERLNNQLIYGKYNNQTYITNAVFDTDYNIIAGNIYQYYNQSNWFIFSIRFNNNEIRDDTMIVYTVNNSIDNVIDTLPSNISQILLPDINFIKTNIGQNVLDNKITYGDFKIREIMFFDGGLDDASMSAIGQQLYNKYNAPPAYVASKNGALKPSILSPSPVEQPPDPLTATNITAFSVDISFTILEKAANVTNITITPLPAGASLIRTLPLTDSPPYTVILSGLDASSIYSGLQLNIFYGGVTSLATPINPFITLRITRTASAGASLQYTPTYDISTLTVKHAWNPSGYTFVPVNPVIKYSIDFSGALAYSNLYSTSYNETSTRSNIYDTSYNYRLYTTNVSGELLQSTTLKIPGLVPTVISPSQGGTATAPTFTDVSFYLDPSLNQYLQPTAGIIITIKENLTNTTVTTRNYNSSYSSNGFYSITNVSGLIPNTRHTISVRPQYSLELIQGQIPSSGFIDPTFNTPGYNSPYSIIYSVKPSSCDISFTVSYATDLSSLSISGLQAGVTSNIGLLTVPSANAVQQYGITISGLVPGTTYNTSSNRMQIVARFGQAAQYSTMADLSFRTDIFAAPTSFTTSNLKATSVDISFRIPTYANLLTDLSVVGLPVGAIITKPSPIPVNLVDTSRNYTISLSGLTSGTTYSNISFGAIYGNYSRIAGFTFITTSNIFSYTVSDITNVNSYRTNMSNVNNYNKKSTVYVPALTNINRIDISYTVSYTEINDNDNLFRTIINMISPSGDIVTLTAGDLASYNNRENSSYYSLNINILTKSGISINPGDIGNGGTFGTRTNDGYQSTVSSLSRNHSAGNWGIILSNQITGKNQVNTNTNSQVNEISLRNIKIRFQID